LDLPKAVIKTLPENTVHNLLYFLRSNEGLARQAQTVAKAFQKMSPLPQSLVPLLSEGDPTLLNSKQYVLCECCYWDAHGHVCCLLLLYRTYSKEPIKPQDGFIKVSDVNDCCHVSGLMEEIGYSCCETPHNLRDILKEFPELRESDVARIVGMMARTYTGLEGGVGLYDFPPTGFNAVVGDKPLDSSSSKSWNIAVFVDVLKEDVSVVNSPHMYVCMYGRITNCYFSTQS
jgi:hypothetical protein